MWCECPSQAISRIYHCYLRPFYMAYSSFVINFIKIHNNLCFEYEFHGLINDSHIEIGVCLVSSGGASCAREEKLGLVNIELG